MLGTGAAKGKGAAKAVGGVRGEAPVLDLPALALRPPAVAKPKGDAKRKAAPKGGAVKPVDEAKGVAKGRAVAGAAVETVFSVACRLAGGPPVLLPTMGLAAVLPPHLPAPRASGAAPALAAAPPNAMGLPPGLAMPAFHRGLHPAGFPPLPGGAFAPPVKVGVGPPPLASVPAPTSSPNSDGLRWFHGPASYNDLHIMVVNPGDFLEFLVPHAHVGWRGAGKQRHWLFRGSAVRGLQ